VNVGAVVVGGDYQGLGIVRSLGRRGIPICVIDDEWSIARFSRYATYHAKYPDLRDPAKLIAAVLETGRRLKLDGWVLFPTREETVAAFSHAREELGREFRVPTPQWSSVQWAWDKRFTHKLAVELGIPTPRTWAPCSEKELDDIDLSPPYVLKPAIKEHFFYKTKAKAWRAENRQQLKELFSLAVKYTAPGEILIQELIPGDGQFQYSFCGFFKRGETIGSMVARRQRQHPHEFGRASTYVETVDNPELEKVSERYLKAMNYYGLVEIEYKLDAKDGLFKLHDVNPRTWGYHSLGYAAGVDFPYLLFADQLGTPISRVRGKVGMRWVRLVTDLPSSLLDIIAGRLAIREYLHTMRAGWTEAVFSLSDPLPGIAELALLPYLFSKRGF
jgi:predicted ATP-grasp superfamily ATP-dependent carboligase